MRQTPYGALRGAAPSSWPIGWVSSTGLLVNNSRARRCALWWQGKSIQGSNWESEKTTYTGRARAAQQQQSWMDTNRRKAMADAGISEADYAKALADAHKTKWDVIKEVAWEVLKEISGWNDIVDCFTGGDIWACGGMIAGLVPWGKVGKILEAGYNAVKAVSRLSSVIDKARGVLRRVDSINEDLQSIADEKFKKVGGSGDSCALHSFVATTLVLMADGSTKPISEVDIGDKVKATDPTTGDTTDRDVVATIVHDDEGDMTRLTVESEDGTTGTVDATSWHPVWVDAEGRFVNIGDLKPGQHLTSADGTSPKVTDVDRYTHFEPVYDLTIEGVHTYYVLAGTSDFLVHNCGTGKWSSDDPDVGELANAIEDRYPGHVLAVNHTRDGVELDIETANAIIEVKGGNGAGLTSRIERRQGPSAINPEGKPVIGYAQRMGRASKTINDAGGIAAGGKHSTLEDLLEVLRP